MKKLFTLLSLCMVLFYSCGTNSDKPYPELQTAISDVQQKYVPDKRDNVFDIEVIDVNGTPVVKGYTTVADAQKELWDLLSQKNSKIVDSITLLPDANLEGKIYGVTNLSVANIRTKPSYAAEMATQVLLGMPVKVLQKQGGWWRVQTAEGYIGWVTNGAFQSMTKEEFNACIIAPKIVFTDYYGFAYEKADENSQRVSDLVNCNMMKLEGDAGRFYKVSYPDGRIGYVLKSQSKPFEQWLASIELTEESIVNKAFMSMGIPYLWAGTSVKGLDCSGFTKTTLLMHGVITRRDASQQVHTGTPVDITNGYDNLRPGDLMFFGKEAEGDKKMRIRHVGFYIGNKEFIHASGRIKVNSLDPNAPNYDEGNTKEFIRASRVIGAVDTEGLWSIQNNPLYNVQE